MALFWKAPLDELANPLHTPNPAKAPWYFTGLQELLHYFPPFVAGIILPVLIVSGLFFIPFVPFFDDVTTGGLATGGFATSPDGSLRSRLSWSSLSALLIRVHAWDALLPLWIVVTLLCVAGRICRPAKRISKLAQFAIALILDHDAVPDGGCRYSPPWAHFSGVRAGPGYGPGGAR